METLFALGYAVLLGCFFVSVIKFFYYIIRGILS